MTTGKAESVGLRAAVEATLGVSPTTGWLVIQPDQAGITDFYLKTTTVAPSPISVLRQREAPELVDADAMPKLTMDLTQDHLYAFREGMMLSVTKHNGGTGVSRFFPTARTSTDFTVAAGGALQAGTLVSSKGWLNAANNGLFVVGASSTGTAIKVAGGVAETPAGVYPVAVEVAGFRGASGDITIDVNGNILSTVADFTTMGLQAGQVIHVGGDAGSAFSFAVYRGFVQITNVAAHVLTTNPAVRQWVQGAADPGTSKTIDLYWSSWIREVAFDSADYPNPETSYQLELSIPGIGAANATVYCYGQGCLVDEFKITAASKALIKMDMTFSGNFITNPSVTRNTGPSTAQPVLERQRYNAVTKQRYLRLTDAATGAIVSNKVMSWNMTHKNGVSPIKQQGTFGTAENIVGKAELDVEMECFVNQTEGIAAAPNNTTLTFGSGFNNGDGGVFFLVPSLKSNEGSTTFPANQAIMLSLKNSGFRDAVGNYTLGVSMFGYLPAA